MKATALFIMAALFVVPLHSTAGKDGEAKVKSEAKFIRIRNGTNINGGKTENPHIKEIPDAFDGRKLSLRYPSSSEPLEFEVKESGIVYLLSGPKHLNSLQKKGWSKVDTILVEGVNHPIELTVLKQKLDVGKYSIPNSGMYGVRLIK
jgi:hypothetical protein